MSINNAAYVIDTELAGEIIVDVGAAVEYAYDENTSVYLMGYDSLNYQENISKSIVSLADNIRDIKDSGIAASDAALITSRDEAIQAVQDSADDTINNINTLAKESVLLSLDEFNVSIQTTEDEINTIKNDTDNLTNIIGNEESGLVKEVNHNTIMIGDENSGLIKTINDINIDLQEPMNILGESSILYPELTTGLIEAVQINSSTLETLPQQVSDLSDAIGTHDSGLIYTVNNNDRLLNGTSDDPTTGLVYIITSNNGLIDQVNTLNENVDIEAIAASNAQIGANTENIENLQITVGDENSGLVYNTSVNTDDINNLKSTVGSIEFSNGLVNDVSILKEYVGNPDIPNTLVSDVNILNSYNLSKVSSDVLGESEDGSDSLKTIIDNLNDDVIIPSINNTLTSNDILYNGDKLNELFNILDAEATTALKDQFDSYFYDPETEEYIDINEITGRTPIDNWINDTTISGFTSLTNEVVNDNQKLNDNIDNVTILKSGYDTAGSIDYKIYTQISKEVLGDLDDVNDHGRLGEVEAYVNELSTEVDNKIDTKITTYNDDIVNPSLNAINTNITNTKVEIDKNIDEVSLESVKYLTFLPWLQKMLEDIANGDATKDDVTNSFGTIIENLTNVLDSNSGIVNDYNIILDPDDNNYILFSINLERGTSFAETNIIFDFKIDDIDWTLSFDLTDDEMSQTSVIRRLENNWVNDSNDDTLIATADDLLNTAAKYTITNILGLSQEVWA